MNKSSTFFKTILFFFSWAPICAFAQYTAIPDNNFEQELIDLGVDTEGILNGQILTADAQAVITLDVSSSNIDDLTGIEDFTNLQRLYCYDNKLTSLDVSNCTALEYLSCEFNQLTSLDVSNCNALIWLYCYKNQLSSLDVSNCIALYELNCFDNQLTSLNVSNCTNLYSFYCFNNQLTSLDVSNCNNLRYFRCNSNQLTSLDVRNGNNTSMDSYDFFANNLTCIDVDNPIWSGTHWTNIDPGVYYSTSCASDLYTAIPDSTFEQKLIDLGVDTEGILNGQILTTDAQAAISLDVVSSNISDLTGIEDFTNLKTLYCYNNQLTSLDVSNCNALETLYCTNNQLTSLDVSNCTNLQILECQYNQLTSLDVSNCNNLYSFYCFNNQLTSLDFRNGNNTVIPLWGFVAYNNNLTCIDVDDPIWSAVNWTYIDPGVIYSTSCASGLYTAIPDSTFERKLINLGIDTDSIINGQILTTDAQAVISLNVSFSNIDDLTGIEDFTNLLYLYCSENNLTSLDVSNCNALEYLYCHDNNLTSLDVSNGNALEFLDCQFNQLTNLDVSNCTALDELYCYNNQLMSLDVSNCNALYKLDCYNNQLTNLDVSNCNALRSLLCRNNQLTSLDVSNCNALEYLYCEDNQLTSLDVSNCTVLQYLYCHDNNLTSLDVSNCNALYKLDCYNNQLTSLGVSNCNALYKLDCYNNQLTNLDVSTCTALYELYCFNNQLMSLDVRNGNNTNIDNSDFFAYNNNLTCIDVDDPSYSTTYWTNIDPGVIYSTSCASALPVELTSFTVQLKNNQTYLQWQTASETDNEGFEIEHSVDGINWQMIGFEQGNGTSFETNEYKFIHEQPKGGVNYYRLKQLDYDGVFEYSNVLSIHFSKEKKEIAIFPNPSTGILNLSVNNFEGTGTLSIYDMSGKAIYQKVIEEARQLDLSNQPKGIYWSKWQIGREVLWEKIVLQ